MSSNEPIYLRQKKVQTYNVITNKLHSKLLLQKKPAENVGEIDTRAILYICKPRIFKILNNSVADNEYRLYNSGLFTVSFTDLD
jgi:hypothetical protein